MKLRRWLFVAAFFLMSCVSISPNWKYDDVTEIRDNILTVESTFDYRFPSRSDEFKGKMVGAVTYIGDGYFVGAAHCFNNTTTIVSTMFGLQEIPIVSDNVEYTLDDINLKLVGSEGDVILFRVNGMNYDLGLPVYKWYDSDKLKTLDKILLVGTPFMTEPNVRIGIVSDADVVESTTNPLSLEEFNNIFNMSIDGVPGDSGRAIFVNEDGELKIVGLLFSTTSGAAFSSAWKSNYVLEVIERLKEK